MSEQGICQSCGVTLAEDAVEGLCPQCMLKEVSLGSGHNDATEPAAVREEKSVSIGR